MPCDSIKICGQNQSEILTPKTVFQKKKGFLNETQSDNSQNLYDDVSTQNQSDGEFMFTTFDEEFEFEELPELRLSSQTEQESTECSLDSSVISAPKISMKLNLNAVFGLDDKFGKDGDIRPRFNSVRFQKGLKRPSKIPIFKKNKNLTMRYQVDKQDNVSEDSDD